MRNISIRIPLKIPRCDHFPLHTHARALERLHSHGLRDSQASATRTPVAAPRCDARVRRQKLEPASQPLAFRHQFLFSSASAFAPQVPPKPRFVPSPLRFARDVVVAVLASVSFVGLHFFVLHEHLVRSSVGARQPGIKKEGINQPSHGPPCRSIKKCI